MLDQKIATLSDLSIKGFLIQIVLSIGNNSVNANALIDSGASSNFISEAFLQNKPFKQTQLKDPQSVRLANGYQILLTKQLSSVIIKVFPNTSDSNSSMNAIPSSFLVAPITFDVILGLPWLQSANPKINWKTLQLNSLNVDLPNSNLEKIQYQLPDNVPPVYRSYSSIFHDNSVDKLPPHRSFDLSIDLVKDAIPKFSPIYHLSQKETQILKSWIDENLEKGFIKPTKSPYGAPIFFVPKKDGTLRPCIDYRALNSDTIKDKYPLPLIDQFLDRLNGAKIFTSLDLKGAYNLVRIKEGHEQKAAFRSVFGHFEPLVIQFGLVNAPAAFQRFLNHIFSDVLEVFVFIYLDDILIFSKDMDSHIKHVSIVLKRLQENHLILKVSKCHFHVKETEFLGFTINADGITMQSKKLDSILKFETPNSVSKIRSFLGIINYYRRFIPDLSVKSLPLIELTKKNSNFNWTTECQNAYDELKKCFSENVTLIHPDFNKPLLLHTDASNFAIGAVLSQFDDKKRLRPIAYYSRKLSDSERNYTIYDKELLAIIAAFKQWRPYLYGSNHPIQVTSDHKNLSYFRSAKFLKPRHARWAEFLSQFDFQIAHIPGVENKIADALSRADDLKKEDSKDKNEILLPDKYWETISVLSNQEWPEFIAYYLIHDVWPEGVDGNLYSNELKNFVIRNEKLYYLKDNYEILYLPVNQRLQALKRFHDGLGHLASNSILVLLLRRFWWPHVQDDLKQYIAECSKCQLSRSVSQRQIPLEPIPPVALPFERIGLDFVSNLPKTKDGNCHIITLVDYATRWTIAKAVKEMTSDVVVKFLYEEVLMNHGSPYEIITDRGSSFLSETMKQFEEMLDIRHHATSPYHPQSNGLCERMHAMLNHSITTLVEGHPDRWDEYLPQIIFSLRVRTHAVTKFSPFFLLYGYEPRLPGDTDPPRQSMVPLDELEKKELRQEFTARELEDLGQHRAAAYYRSLKQAELMEKKNQSPDDKKDHYFEIGDMVKLKHFTKTKFEFRWRGPYHVVKLGFPRTYYIMDANGRWLDAPTNERDLAPWISRTIDNEDYFYDGSQRIIEEPSQL